MNRLYKVFATICFVFLINDVMGPPPGPPGGGGGNGPKCWPPPCVPITNGIPLLVIGGILLAVYKVLDLKRNPKELENNN